MDSGYAQSRLQYPSGSALYPSTSGGAATSGFLSVPLSAPASLSGSGGASLYGPGQNAYNSSSGGYPSNANGARMEDNSARYTFPDAHHQSASPQPGSGYATPQ